MAYPLPDRRTMDEEKTLLRILLAEENERDDVALRDLLAAMHTPRVQPARATTHQAALQALSRGEHDVCLAAHDFGRQAGGGLRLLREARARGYRTPILLILDERDEEAIAAATAAGAAGCLLREELSLPLLTQSLRYAVAHAQADAARRQSETRYRLLFANMLEGMALHEIVYDDDGAPLDYAILDVNPRFEEKLGVSKQMVAGQPASAVYNELDAPIIDYFNQVATTGRPTRFEAHFPPTGHAFSISAFSPEPGRLAAIFRDVTARKSAERQSRRQTARAEALVRIAARLNARLDLEGILQAVCEETARALDAPAVSLILYDEQQDRFHYAASVGLPPNFNRLARPVPRAIYEMLVREQGPLIVIPDVQERDDLANNELFAAVDVRTLAVATLARGEQLMGALNVKSLGRRRAFSEGELALLQGIADQAVQAISNARLFAETDRLLRQTRRHAQQVQQIVDTLPEGVLLLNADHRLVLANPVAREFLPLLAQMTEEKDITRLGNQPLVDLLQPEADGPIWQEIAISRPERIFEVGGRAVRSEGRVGGWVLVVRDVTDERRHQEYVQTQDRLATVGQLAAGIAHDFNNIMAIISLYSETLERDPDLPKRKEYLGTIKKQARHAASLIGQILDFSRSATVERSPLDLTPFLKEAVKLLKRTMPETIHLTLRMKDEVCRVQGDPTRLQQAIMNLAVNARDAMPGGGELTIHLDHVQVAPDRQPPVPNMAPGRWVRLTVADTGAGIPAGDLPHIFEPFYTTKKRGEGTGLGLAQVYGIVKQHGGEIAVDSQEGQGTTFTIYLPALEESVPQEREEDEPPPPPAPDAETILIAEDEEEMRAAIQDILLDLGYRVLVAADGREALALFNEHGAAVDLVISDVVMPEMGGEELHQTLRRRWSQMKMILMSGYPLGESGRKFMEDAGTAWIQKPFTASSLAQTVRAILEPPAD